MSILRFPKRHATRACTGCGERFPKGSPAHWRYCRQCYSYGMFRKAIELMRQVRP